MAARHTGAVPSLVPVALYCLWHLTAWLRPRAVPHLSYRAKSDMAPMGCDAGASYFEEEPCNMGACDGSGALRSAGAATLLRSVALTQHSAPL